MSLRLSSSQASHFVSRWGGLGIPGSEVPTTGDNGGSPLANDGISPTSEYRIETVTAPASGTLTVFPDTSYEFSGAPDGAYTWVYRALEDSTDRGTATEYLVVGPPVTQVVASTALPSFSGSAHVEVSFTTSATTTLPSFSGTVSVDGTPAEFAIASLTQPPVFSGGAAVSPIISVTSVTQLPVFSGGASRSEVISFEFSSTTPGATFSGSATGYVPSGTSLTPEDIAAIAAAVVAALNATAIPVDIQKVRGQNLTGNGSEATPWGPA